MLIIILSFLPEDTTLSDGKILCQIISVFSPSDNQRLISLICTTLLDRGSTFLQLIRSSLFFIILKRFFKFSLLKFSFLFLLNPNYKLLNTLVRIAFCIFKLVLPVQMELTKPGRSILVFSQRCFYFDLFLQTHLNLGLVFGSPTDLLIFYICWLWCEKD